MTKALQAGLGSKTLGHVGFEASAEVAGSESEVSSNGEEFEHDEVCGSGAGVSCVEPSSKSSSVDMPSTRPMILQAVDGRRQARMLLKVLTRLEGHSPLIEETRFPNRQRAQTN